jgi:hypothetical protein
LFVAALRTSPQTPDQIIAAAAAALAGQQALAEALQAAALFLAALAEALAAAAVPLVLHWAPALLAVMVPPVT